MQLSGSIPLYNNKYNKINLYQMLVSQRIGGAEKLAIEIHKHASKIGIGRNKLLVPFGGSVQEFFKSESLAYQTYQLDWLLRKERIPHLAANMGLYLKLVRSSHGLLHIHSPYVFGALRPLLSISRIRTILHLHLDYTIEQLRWAFKLHPDLVIICAKFLKEPVEQLLSESGQNKTKIAVVINAVDTKRFFPSERLQAKKKFGISLEKPLLLMIANLAPHKGQETAIRATSILVKRGYNPLLWLVGEEREEEGTYKKYLQDLIKEIGLSPFVEFLGFRQDIAELLHAADFLLLPSKHEGLPLVILEAQASKVVVLAAPTAGIPEVIENGRTGYLIEADNPIGYADTITTLLKNIDIINFITETAYQKIQSSFNLQKYCDTIIQQYSQLIDIQKYQ